MSQIHCQFVDVGERSVFVRHAGAGPAVLLLHQSPQNSRAMIPWIERLSLRYAVFAPDTPGFGFSDPLAAAQPTIPDFAAALKALLDRLGLERVLVYGVHTGAVTALRLALDYPANVAALVCDGYARFSAEERQKLLDGYLPPFEPLPFGEHLTWLWGRFREQNLFFPWNVNSKAARLQYPAPATEKLHGDVMDVLDAGDGYRAGYRAPFLYDDASAAGRLTVPAHIFYRAEDVLAPHLSRLGTLPANVVAARIEGGAAVLAASNDDHFAAHAAAVSVVDAAKQVASATSAMSATRRVFMTSSGMMSCLMRPGEAGTVMLVLPDVGAPAQIPASLPSAQRVLVSELPGHGASRPWPAAQCTVHNAAQAITDVIRQLGITRFAVQAHGVSCAIAALLCHEPGCEAVELHNPLVLEAAEREQFLSLLPDATPHATGAHLVAAWNWVRMKYLFWPWLPQDGKAARMVDAPAPRRVHEETLQVLRCGAGLQPLCASALAVDMAKELGHSNAHVRLFCDAEPEPRRLAQRLADHLQLHKQDSASGDGAWSRQ